MQRQSKYRYGSKRMFKAIEWHQLNKTVDSDLKYKLTEYLYQILIIISGVNSDD